ncbi:MAG: efflux RND transporter periplasmic adaptor subunit [Kiritimatiellae bacterium]|nr:efflux RND transporter periplasmic adaptor subunit [Kiritimatiellia bacterium]
MKSMLFVSFVFAGAVCFGAESLTLPVATVAARADRRALTYPGRVVSVARVDVVPQVSGEILEVCFANGAVVKAGDVLYRIDPVQYEAAVKNAESKLAECKASAQYAELSYGRHSKLLDTRAVSADSVDNALSQRDSLRAALAAAQADLVAARDDLKHCTIVAPIAGKLGSTTKTKGNYTVKGGETLVTLVQASPIRVCFAISNREFLDYFGGVGGRIREDSEVSLSLANGEPYGERGAVEYVDNESDDRTDTTLVYVLFRNDDRKLRAGGTVSVTLSSKNGCARPAIPPTAILQDTQGPYVWVLDENGVASRRSVARGEAVGDWLFVEKGLKVGERIVADGAHRVKRGMVVSPAPEAR